MKIFALVCTLNEAVHIESRILNLRSLHIPGKVEYEIHVLDNGSVDATREIAGRIVEVSGAPVMVHQLEPIGKCGALFWAFQNLTADYYLLTDANTVFAKSVLAEVAAAISQHPEAGLFIGNFRSVKSGDQGSRFLASDAPMPLRLRIEMKLDICTGANGGCYCVKQEALDDIWFAPPVRNDDFIISIFASSRASVQFVERVKAYEVENLIALQSFRQKYRDALGHHQAISWILHNTSGLRSRIAVLFRLMYWMTPAVAGLTTLAVFHWYIVGVAALGLAMSSRIRMTGVRTVALYAGYIAGMFRSPPVRWSPAR
ncbi:MAG: glycosyltransferase family 2 protein [Desulfurivibrionaceae bacterium]